MRFFNFGEVIFYEWMMLLIFIIQLLAPNIIYSIVRRNLGTMLELLLVTLSNFNSTCVDLVHTKNIVDQVQAHDPLYYFNIHYIILAYTISL